MNIKINGVEIAEYPKEFSVTVLDIDNGDTTTRTANGVLNRDRITTKRQIDMSWGVVEWSKIASVLQAMSNTFFEVYYPDPMEGTYTTKTFYVGNRPAPVAVSAKGKILWNGLKVTLTER